MEVPFVIHREVIEAYGPQLYVVIDSTKEHLTNVCGLPCDGWLLHDEIYVRDPISVGILKFCWSTIVTVYDELLEVSRGQLRQHE